MNEANLSMVEIARRNGCTDVVTLAKIERAEYISELLHSALTWIGRKCSTIAHEVAALFVRHAH